MGLRGFRLLGPMHRLVVAGWKKDAAFKRTRIAAFLSPGENLLDIGSGFGLVTPLLEADGHQVTCCDVMDNSAPDGHSPTVFDGRTLPYSDAQFTAALLLTVLHHTSEPERVLVEAARVASRVIVIEDVYESAGQRWLTHRADSLLNLEFQGHPHSNRTHREWLSTFRRLGLELYGMRSDRFLGLSRQNTYALKVSAEAMGTQSPPRRTAH